MTRQEEIREGIVEPICEACMPYICAHWELEPRERLEKCKPLNKWVDRILKSESDLGVVIRVKRELPIRHGKDLIISCCDKCNHKDLIDSYSQNVGISDMLKAGYVAVEPLIEEVSNAPL